MYFIRKITSSMVKIIDPIDPMDVMDGSYYADVQLSVAILYLFLAHAS